MNEVEARNQASAAYTQIKGICDDVNQETRSTQLTQLMCGFLSLDWLIRGP